MKLIISLAVIMLAGCSHKPPQSDQEYIRTHGCVRGPRVDKGEGFTVYYDGEVHKANGGGGFQSYSCPNHVQVIIDDGDEQP